MSHIVLNGFCLDDFGGSAHTGGRRGRAHPRRQIDQGYGVVNTLADCLTEIGDHFGDVKLRKKPRRGRFPRRDAAVIAKFDEYSEERLDDVDQRLRHAQHAEWSEQRQVLRLEEVEAAVAVGALISRRRRGVWGQAVVERSRMEVQNSEDRIQVGDHVERIQREIRETVVLPGDVDGVELGCGRPRAVERPVENRDVETREPGGETAVGHMGRSLQHEVDIGCRGALRVLCGQPVLHHVGDRRTL